MFLSDGRAEYIFMENSLIPSFSWSNDVTSVLAEVTVILPVSDVTDESVLVCSGLLFGVCLPHAASPAHMQALSSNAVNFFLI